ncbi:MAG: WhiB family transcriptional regulator [Acidimicrobiia bacterium]
MRNLIFADTEERPWVELAACRGVDPGLFFPGQQGDSGPALAICATCPVRVQCLEWALEVREPYGIWGGTTERQRRRLLRRSA